MKRSYAYLLAGAAVAWLILRRKKQMEPVNLPEEDGGWWPDWLSW